MQPIVIDAVDTTALEAEQTSLAASAPASITTIAEHATAGEQLVRIATWRKQVVGLFEPAKKAAHAAHKAVCEAERKLLEPIDRKRAELERVMSAFEIEQRRIADEQRRRLEEQARREEEERRREEAARLEEEKRAIKAKADAEAAAAKAAGNTQAAKDARAAGREEAARLEQEREQILSEPVIAPVIHVPVPLAKTEGVSSSTRYSAEVTDLAALIKHVAARIDDEPGLASYLLPNGPALNRLATSQRDAMRVPGVRVVKTTQRAVRSA